MSQVSQNAAPSSAVAAGLMDSSIRKRLEIIDVEKKKAQKSGFEYLVAQCIVHGEKKKVGELMVFNPDLYPLVVEGEFFATFEIGVDRDRMVTAELVALDPVEAPQAVTPKPTAPAPASSEKKAA